MAAFVVGFFHRIAPATLAPELERSFAVSGAALGLLAATYFYVYMPMQIPTGVMADTIGPRRLLTAGGFAAGVGSLLFGLAPSFGIAIAGRALVGLGVSVIFVSMLKLIAAWFPERRFATMAGLATFLGNVGAVASAAPLAWLVTVTSWRNVFVAMGVASALLGLLSWLAVRNDPRELGLASHRELEGKPDLPAHSGHWLPALRRVLANPSIWPGFLVSVGAGGSFMSFLGLWSVPYLTQARGFSYPIAIAHTTLLSGAFALGCLSVGWLSDRLRRRRAPMLALLGVYCLCWLAWLYAGAMPRAASYALCLVMGMSLSSFTLTWAIAKELSPLPLAGIATSFVNTGTFLGAGLAQPLVGWILDRGWDGRSAHGVKLFGAADYHNAMLLLFGFALSALAASVFLRETGHRQTDELRPL